MVSKRDREEWEAGYIYIHPLRSERSRNAMPMSYHIDRLKRKLKVLLLAPIIIMSVVGFFAEVFIAIKGFIQWLFNL